MFCIYFFPHTLHACACAVPLGDKGDTYLGVSCLSASSTSHIWEIHYVRLRLRKRIDSRNNNFEKNVFLKAQKHIILIVVILLCRIKRQSEPKRCSRCFFFFSLSLVALCNLRWLSGLLGEGWRLRNPSAASWQIRCQESLCLRRLLRVNATQCQHELGVLTARQVIARHVPAIGRLGRPGVDPCSKSGCHSNRGSSLSLHCLWCEGRGPPWAGVLTDPEVSFFATYLCCVWKISWCANFLERRHCGGVSDISLDQTKWRGKEDMGLIWCDRKDVSKNVPSYLGPGDGI